MNKLLCVLTVIGVAMTLTGQSISRPDVPEPIKAPAGEEVVLLLHATGVQIYTCSGPNNGAWSLKAPEADLHDAKGAVVGHHFAGPSWKHNDGSLVTGKAAARVDSPDPNSIPWLLVTVTSHSGEGVFGRVTTIQRVNTKGGQPSSGSDCSATTKNTEVRVPYSADYYFYAPKK